MQIETSTMQDVFTGYTFRVASPEGTLFVNVMEDRTGRPVGIQIYVGKTGAALSAWANAMSRMMTLGFEKGMRVEDFITELSSQTSDRVSGGSHGSDDVPIRSGPEAVAYALMLYQRKKYEDELKAFGVNPEAGRGPQLRKVI